jgi:acyl-CoA synthetase (AMP-forming)/AMP-acid ligase II
VCSGEELTEAAARRCAERLPWVELYNLYGPTEAAIDVSLWRYDPSDSGPVPIGHPVDNTHLHVLDRRLEPVPVGFPGELCIGGVQVARGYLNRPGLTAAAFVDGLYRTGDLARLRPDGALMYLGRLDTQVKIHGVRVELGEIESVLARHPDVRGAVAAVRDDAPGGRGLVAYIDWTGAAGRAVTELRDLLGRHLPLTLLPQAFVLTDTFPALPSGKVDRTALPSPRTADLLPTAYVAPQTPVEAELCALWAELLGREKVGTTDDFFELGGHSLLAAHLVGRVRERYGVDLPLRRCFEVPTVAGQALEILALRLSTLDDDELAALLDRT